MKCQNNRNSHIIDNLSWQKFQHNSIQMQWNSDIMGIPKNGILM